MATSSIAEALLAARACTFSDPIKEALLLHLCPPLSSRTNDSAYQANSLV